MLICARGENFGFAKEIGVGLVESASLLTSLILRENPQSLIFIGSAGSYDENLKIFDIAISHSATQIEHSFTQNKSYTPIDNKIEIVSYETMPLFSQDSTQKQNANTQDSATLMSANTPDSASIDSAVPDSTKSQNLLEIAIKKMSHFHSVIVNSSNYICTDSSYAKQMKNAGIALENMEFFSILKVADYFKIPALGIFCITNYCDENAHSDFLANHSKAHKILESNARQLYDKYF